MTRVVPATEIAGDGAKDTVLLKEMLAEASTYLSSFHWSSQIEQSYFGLGVGGIVAVFLFRVRPSEPNVDDWLWVVVGDLPPAYLVTDEAPNPACALKMYIGLMREWVKAVHEGQPTDELIPVNVDPTEEWANQLGGRLDFLEREVLSRHPDDLMACGSGDSE
jgi:hypothetical protein